MAFINEAGINSNFKRNSANVINTINTMEPSVIVGDWNSGLVSNEISFNINGERITFFQPRI